MDNSRASAFSCAGARTEGKIWDASEEINQSNQAVERTTGRAPESPVDGAPWAHVRGKQGPESPLGASLKWGGGGEAEAREGKVCTISGCGHTARATVHIWKQPTSINGEGEKPWCVSTMYSAKTSNRPLTHGSQKHDGD